MKNQLSQKLYLRARAAAFQAAMLLIAALACGVAGIFTLPNDGFIAWLAVSSSAILMGGSLILSAKAMRLTRYAMAEEEAEWRRALQPFRL